VTLCVEELRQRRNHAAALCALVHAVNNWRRGYSKVRCRPQYVGGLRVGGWGWGVGV